MADDANNPAPADDAQANVTDDGFSDPPAPTATDVKQTESETKAEPAPEAPADAKPADETKDEPSAEPAADSQKADEPAKTEDKPAEADDTATDDPKAQARKAYAERQRIKQEAQQEFSQIKTQTADELEAEGLDRTEALIEAHRQELEQRDFVSHVTELTASMTADAAAIERDFPIMNPKSEGYDEKWATKIAEEYVRDADVRFDNTGKFVLSARVPMYDYIKSRVEDRMTGIQQGQVSGQKSAEKMLAAAEEPSSAAPPASSEDEDAFMKGFNNPF